MELIKTKFKGLVIYKKNTYKDKRGYFRELFLNRQVQEKFPFDAM
jgi:dTDP-4-dehydrorhamnose 3,5-epimerase-like enzyme